MRKIKQFPAVPNEPNPHFLMRPSSTSNLNTLSCLFPCSISNLELTYKQQKIQPRKKSMKNLLQRSVSNKEIKLQRDQSKVNQQDKKTLAYNSSTILKYRKPSELTQMSSSSINIHSQKTTPKKYVRNVDLFFNKQQSHNEISGESQDNNITQKYVRQQEQLNQIDQTIQHQLPKNQQLFSYDFTGLDDLLPENTDTSPKWNQQVHTFAPPVRLSPKDNSTNNCRFSFGQHQNKMFTNKFSGFREVSSNRPSKESFKISEDEIPTVELKNQFQKSNLLNGSTRSKLDAMVRNAHIMDEQFDDFSESNSQVIDSYLNMMGRSQQRNS